MTHEATSDLRHGRCPSCGHGKVVETPPAVTRVEGHDVEELVLGIDHRRAAMLLDGPPPIVLARDEEWNAAEHARVDIAVSMTRSRQRHETEQRRTKANGLG